MPEQKQMMGPTSTPQLYFENQFKLSQQQATQQYQNWRNQYETGAIDIDTFTKEAQNLQTAADEQTAAFQSGMQMMQQSQKFVDLGLISPEQHQEAMWAQVLPRELQEALYPEPEREPMREPFAPGKMDLYQETIEEFAASAPKSIPRKRKFAGIDILRRDIRVPAQKDLLQKYKSWKINIGYGAMTADQQRQVDNEWDAWVAAQKGDWNWNPQSKEVLAARAKGPLTRGYGAQFRGTPTGPREATNPLQVSVATALPKQKEPKPEPQPRMWARNRKTKKRLYSDDGGKTWQPTP